ncbi:hypothetical protein [Antarctobacter heliothermus]|uniref:Uncharacterized protein n=1 Tax=Antarctobacter heliothermus TaxID=74033 RepID=A0A239II30_9RHOB|nr:hypothetical protein [Antarctobacter heliothermus]SNS93225.1 hypothetical protein SAMN04488078_10439 [Antarctobacter heliothermus]
MTHDDLSRYRAGIACCELLMLVDLSTSTVLMSDSDVHFGQERLDHFCDLARSVFSGTFAATGTAILSGPTGSRVFVQSPDDAEEMICGLFGPAANLGAACAAGADLFQRDRMA